MGAAAAILGAMLVYGVVHSWLAWPQAKGLAQRLFGAGSLRWYRLAYNLFAALSLLPVLYLAAALPDEPLYRVPQPWSLAMLAVQGLAGLGLLAAVLQTGALSFVGLAQLFQGGDPAPGRLVESGLYRWMRHPIYTTGMAFLWFTPLMTRNLLLLYAGFSLYFLIGAWFEERKLLREFGQAYRDYQRRVGMFLPRLPR
ncbi:MAG: methyltransferase family protein [Chloroflexota bacterium]